MAESSQTTASPAQIQEKFELGIWHALFHWQDLTVAIQNQWGGPDSEDKRDWLAGAISEIFQTQPDTDALDIEAVLLQALEDEFGVRVEDESEVLVARQIMDIRKQTLEGNFSTVDQLQKEWSERKGKALPTGNMQIIEHSQDTDGESVDDESGSDEEEGDVDMTDAPPAASKPKPIPEVDEDGFTKVVGKRR
ncbi:pre-rRNA-processing protein-like protein TSR2 [Delitschia confertaspora ATCC 74209]|uniref:Pre-rRNA-processing protein-like protein TSR2 n=1 Tax=Delitschia confertaspora ATCC 74209 TaxID=1513339 RepID=A0A9P4MUC6_9PLEO|nr:pre-rRNA-processing protein-like protein TSR2 [Delitschia confertaspora ATCC 74209]